VSVLLQDEATVLPLPYGLSRCDSVVKACSHLGSGGGGGGRKLGVVTHATQGVKGEVTVGGKRGKESSMAGSTKV